MNKKHNRSFYYLYTNDDKSKFHSYEDRPSLVYDNNTRLWHSHGRVHRRGGLPAVTYANGIQEYWKMGRFVMALDKDGNKVNPVSLFWYRLQTRIKEWKLSSLLHS